MRFKGPGEAGAACWFAVVVRVIVVDLPAARWVEKKGY
jgi:hypothetical protein